ncbi:phage protein NinX family protein [Providencia sp. PROV021]|uniref:phage protein NinX family protein n=1 Tax=Providencia sp. PROV021 TaxID=2949756 RepID=UPI00234AA0B6|nr:phage protein NinX family protein [Providencia sp. PROV021]
MNKYTEVSDFEINMLIARVNDGIHIDDKRTAIDCYIHSQSSPSSVRVWDGDIGYLTFDFCNNPADAMPIIIDSKIAAVPQLNGDLWVCSRHPFYVTTNNLYRAAMELFLLMKDAENSNGN